MPPIYVMAAVTLAASLALWGGLIYQLSGRQRRYFWLLWLGLPLSAVANLLIKRPAIVAVGQAAHIPVGLGALAPAWFLAFQVLITPVAEEVVKLTPLLIGPARKGITGQASAFWVGFVLGVSFGLGEAAYIAYAVARLPQYAQLPWYAFTGYFSERIMACFGHGVFTAVLVTALARGPKFILPGYLAACGLHFFLNLPAVFYQLQWISMEVEGLIVAIPFITLAIVFERMRRGFPMGEAEGARNEVVYLQR